MSDTYDTETEIETPAAAPVPAASEKSKKRKVSERTVLDNDGNELESELGAAAVNYKSLTENWDVTVTYDEAPEDVRRACWAFGMLTKLGNETNRVRNGKGGPNAPATEREAVDAWLDLYRAGSWVSERGEVVTGSKVLVEAIIRAKARYENKTLDEAAVTAYVDGLSKEERKATRNIEQIKVCIAEISAERAAARAAELAAAAGDAQGAIAGLDL